MGRAGREEDRQVIKVKRKEKEKKEEKEKSHTPKIHHSCQEYISLPLSTP